MSENYVFLTLSKSSRLFYSNFLTYRTQVLPKENTSRPVVFRKTCSAWKLLRWVGPRNIREIDNYNFYFFYDNHSLFQELGSTVTFDNRVVAENSDILLLAVKPSIVKPVLEFIYPNITSKHLLLSVAMGITVNQLEKVITTCLVSWYIGNTLFGRTV